MVFNRFMDQKDKKQTEEDQKLTKFFEDQTGSNNSKIENYKNIPKTGLKKKI